MRTRGALGSGALLAGLMLAPVPTPAEREEPRVNFAVVVVDGARPDHMGAYGYGRPATPHIDGLAAAGAVFEHAFAHSSQPESSLASLLTSLHPVGHGVWDHRDRLPAWRKPLSRLFRKRGYRTALLSWDDLVKRKLHRGSDHVFRGEGPTLDALVPEALRWLEAEPGKPFFVVLHSGDLRPPLRRSEKGSQRSGSDYDGPLRGLIADRALGNRIRGLTLYRRPDRMEKQADLAPRDLAHLASLYDAALSRADEQVGRLLAGLARLGLKERTVLVVVAPYAEAMGGRGEILSSLGEGLSDDVLHVPLILSGPGVAPGRVRAPVGLVDVWPTLLDLAGIDAPPKVQGRSLAPALRGGREADPKRAIFSQIWPRSESSPRFAMRRPPWKLVVGHGIEDLYHLGSDPAEKRDLSSARPRALREHRDLLERWKRRTRPMRPEFVRRHPYAGALGRLRKAAPGERPSGEVALGYFHGSRAHLLYRAYVRKYFADEGVPVTLFTKVLAPGDDEFYEVPDSAMQMGRLLFDTDKDFGKVTGIEVLKAVEDGTLDGGVVGESSFLLEVARGNPLVAVAMLGRDTAQKPGKALVLRRDVAIRSPEDFKGKVLMSRRAGPGDAVFLKEFVSSIGLDPRRDVVILEQTHDRSQARLLRETEVHGGLFHRRTIKSHAGESGPAYVYRRMDWVDPQLSHTLLVFRRDFVAQRAGDVEKILRAVVRAIRDARKGTGDSAGAKSFGRIRDFQMDMYLGSGDLPTYDIPPVVRPDLLEGVRDLLLKHGAIREKVPLDGCYDTGLAGRAARRREP